MQSALLFSEIEKIADLLEPKVAEYIGTKQTFAFESFEKSNIFAFEWKNINISQKPEKFCFTLTRKICLYFVKAANVYKAFLLFCQKGFPMKRPFILFL